MNFFRAKNVAWVQSKSRYLLLFIHETSFFFIGKTKIHFRQSFIIFSSGLI